MTPLQAAKTHCANYQPDGSCLGIAFSDTLSMYRFRREGSKCVLHDSPCPACPYFEEIVLPQVLQSVATRYRKSLAVGEKTTVSNTTTRRCPDCNTRELSKRQRYCNQCRINRRRNSRLRNRGLKWDS